MGDTGYADDYKKGANSYVFDRHFKEIQAYASRIPFMTVPGNHESQYKFAGYLNRLKMPVMGTGPLKVSELCPKQISLEIICFSFL
jgi:hypothetical protein